MEQGSKTTKQVGVEVELRGKSPSDLVADTQQTPEVVAENQQWMMRVPDMYVPSLHYLLLMKGNQNPLMRSYSWRIQPSRSKPWMMRRLGFKNALY